MVPAPPIPIKPRILMVVNLLTAILTEKVKNPLFAPLVGRIGKYARDSLTSMPEPQLIQFLTFSQQMLSDVASPDLTDDQFADRLAAAFEKASEDPSRPD